VPPPPPFPQPAGSMPTPDAGDTPARAWAASLGSCGPRSPRYVSAAELAGWTEFRLAFASPPVAEWLAPLLPTAAVAPRTWSDLDGVSHAHLAEALVVCSCVQVIVATSTGAPRAPPTADASAGAPAPWGGAAQGAAAPPAPPTEARTARPQTPAAAEWGDDPWAAPPSPAAATAVGADPAAADAQWGDDPSAEFSFSAPTPVPGAGAAQRGEHLWSGFPSAVPAPPAPPPLVGSHPGAAGAKWGGDLWAGPASAIPQTPVGSVPALRCLSGVGAH